LLFVGVRGGGFLGMAHGFCEEDMKGLYVGPSLGLGLGCNEFARGFEEEERVPAREEGSGDRHGACGVGKPKWERKGSVNKILSTL